MPMANRKAKHLTSTIKVMVNHPLVCYYGLTRYLIKIQLCDGTQYSSTGVVDFLQPILDEYLIKFYCKRGLMENFIKESKTGFDFDSVSSHTRIVNANRLQIHALAYNIFNWFRRLALSANMRRQRIDTVRLKLLKIAAKVIRSARYMKFKLCSSCPYKDEFYNTLYNISKLCIQL